MQALCDSHPCAMQALREAHLCIMQALCGSYLCAMQAVCDSHLCAMQALYAVHLCAMQALRDSHSPLCYMLTAYPPCMAGMEGTAGLCLLPALVYSDVCRVVVWLILAGLC